MVLHLNKLESTPPKDAFGQVRVKLAESFWRRRFLKFINWMYFCYFVITCTSPWKRVWPFIWGNLKSPPSRDALCSFVQSLVELVQWFWRRRFLNFINAFSLFCNYFPLEKGVGLYFSRQMDGQTDNRKSGNLGFFIHIVHSKNLSSCFPFVLYNIKWAKYNTIQMDNMMRGFLNTLCIKITNKKTFEHSRKWCQTGSKHEPPTHGILQEYNISIFYTMFYFI